MLTALGSVLLLTYDEALSNFALNINLRRYNMGALSTDLGLAALAAVLGGAANIAASPFAWDRLSAVLKPMPDMFTDLVRHRHCTVHHNPTFTVLAFNASS